MNNFKNIMWGLVLVIVGVFVGLRSFDILDFNIFFDGWWTLFIIIPSIIGLITDEEKAGSIIWLIIGVLLLLSCQNVITFELLWKLLPSLILVLIGLSLLLKNVFKRNINNRINELKEKEINNEYTATFNGLKQVVEKDFEGCKLNAIFGEIDLDLRKANIKKDVVITVSAIFGGIDIKVPENVNIEVSTNSIFGGIDSKVKNDDKNKTTIYITGSCIFGGVDIK